MRYCADTWFILSLFNRDVKSIQIIKETKEGKVYLILPVIVLAESTKKMLQKGVPQQTIDLFWGGIEASEKAKLIPIDKAIAKEAAKISLTYSLPMIDSLVAATANLTGCDVLFSGDSDYQLLAKKKYLKVQSW